MERSTLLTAAQASKLMMRIRKRFETVESEFVSMSADIESFDAGRGWGALMDGDGDTYKSLPACISDQLGVSDRQARSIISQSKTKALLMNREEVGEQARIFSGNSLDSIAKVRDEEDKVKVAAAAVEIAESEGSERVNEGHVAAAVEKMKSASAPKRKPVQKAKQVIEEKPVGAYLDVMEADAKKIIRMAGDAEATGEYERHANSIRDVLKELLLLIREWRKAK